MKFRRLCFCVTTLTSILMFQDFSTALGQKPTNCKVRDKSLRKVEYRIGSFQRSNVDPDRPPILTLGISVKPEQINADYIVSLARNLNQRFCKEDQLVVGIYDRYEIAVYFNGDFQDDLNAYRGYYFLNRTTGEEYVSFSTVPDYQGNPQARIKIDLNLKIAPCSKQP